MYSKLLHNMFKRLWKARKAAFLFPDIAIAFEYLLCQTEKGIGPDDQVRRMEPKECFYREQFGYCWLVDDRWLFQAVDVREQPLGEPVEVELSELVFHHDEDEELH